MEKIKTSKIEEKDINYDIYNALNLLNENLGESYLTQGFNPFDEGFELSEEFALERYHNACQKKEIISPDFINQGTKQTQKAFETSVQNLDALILNVDQLLSDYTLDEKTKKQYENIRLYLICRRQLTLIFIAKLKKQKNTLKMYEELTFLNHELEEYCTDIFTEFYNIQNAINAFIAFAKNNKLSKEDKELIQKAKDIIKHNQEKQANQIATRASKASSASKVKLPTFAKEQQPKEEAKEIATPKNGEHNKATQTRSAQIVKSSNQTTSQTTDPMVLKYQEFIKNRDAENLKEPTHTTPAKEEPFTAKEPESTSLKQTETER